MIKKITAWILACAILCVPLCGAAAEEAAGGTMELACKSAVLMEQTTGKVLYEMNAHEKLPPASITKVMTLLLVMEAIENGKLALTDTVTVSENAKSMGGSEIWLEVGEQMSVDDLIKATCVASANDAAMALAEQVAGSEEAFVAMMNEKAKELGMNDSSFQNPTGLDDTDANITSAYDIALMSRELIRHEKIKEYSTIWMDSLRGGKTALVNTNKLVRFYEGATGLKTGTTNKAGSCLSATATRGGLSLVAVVMGSTTSDDRFASAKKLLNYGFANWAVAVPENIAEQIEDIKVIGGVSPSVGAMCDPPESILVPKGKEAGVEYKIEMVEDLQAPVEQGQTIGKVTVSLDGETVAEYPVKAKEAVEKMTFWRSFQILVKNALSMK